MSWLAIDVGGANLKAADGLGWARSWPFALWNEPHALAAELTSLLKAAPHAQRIAVTMTGELCDCFHTKAEGVRLIVLAAQAAAINRDIQFYLTDGRFVAGERACEMPQLAAASNWHALARFACQFLEGSTGILVDIGSTTTDIVPLIDGQPGSTGWNDTDRLLAGELVYTGVGRTPLCAVTPRIPWRGKYCPVAAEFFATTADAYRMLDCLVEPSDSTWTADGRPLTKEYSRARLARMICADATLFNDADAVQVAVFIRQLQLSQLQNALLQVMAKMPRQPNRFVVSGSGEFLAAALVAEVAASASIERLTNHIGSAAAVSATAHAVAVLARQTESQLWPQLFGIK
jgi:probable H4MPT-linked C1 transfer pathway protein